MVWMPLICGMAAAKGYKGYIIIIVYCYNSLSYLRVNLIQILIQVHLSEQIFAPH